MARRDKVMESLLLDITEIREGMNKIHKIGTDVAVIKEHLKTMNGSLKKHDTWIFEDHPKEHKEINSFIAKGGIVLGGIVVIATSGLTYLFNKLFGG